MKDEALIRAAAQFRFYQKNHEAQGKAEKAAVNEQMAVMCEQALGPTRGESLTEKSLADALVKIGDMASAPSGAIIGIEELTGLFAQGHRLFWYASQRFCKYPLLVMATGALMQESGFWGMKINPRLSRYHLGMDFISLVDSHVLGNNQYNDWYLFTNIQRAWDHLKVPAEQRTLVDE